jgi:hypothetical protein
MLVRLRGLKYDVTRLRKRNSLDLTIGPAPPEILVRVGGLYNISPDFNRWRFQTTT